MPDAALSAEVPFTTTTSTIVHAARRYPSNLHWTFPDDRPGVGTKGSLLCSSKNARGVATVRQAADELNADNGEMD